MDFTKLNFFKKLNESMPIGLSSLGLKRKKQKYSKSRKKNISSYPCFFKFDRITPVTN